MSRTGDLSLAYLSVDGASPSEHVEAAAAAGFAYAGVRLSPPPHATKELSLLGSSQSLKSLGRLGKSLGVGFLDAEVMCLSSKTESDQMKRMCDACAELGFRFVQTVIDDEDLGRAVDTLASLAAIAEERGLPLALEFMAFRPLNSLAGAISLIHRSGAGNIGLLIDALHFFRAGGTLDEIASVDPGLIALFQLCDAPALAPSFDDLASEARENRLYPGEGGLDLPALLNVLPHGLPVSVEVPRPADEGGDYHARARRAMSATRSFLKSL